MNSIHYKDKQKFEKVLEVIRKEWFEKIHILADFDRTLTKLFVNWEKKTSVISVLRREWYLSEEYRKKAYELFDYYNPIEIDPNVSMDEKNAKMTEWWNKHLQLMVDSKIQKSDIKSVSNSWLIHLREWIKKFLKFLDEKNIPLVILSANWLGSDSISMYLEKEWFSQENIFIISNSFVWDGNWVVIGYDKRVIHPFNKGEKVLSNYPDISQKVKTRKNVILLWDSLWDPDMIEWFLYDNCIKIWFLNEKVEELLEVYKEKYDVVLTWDSDWEFVNEILKEETDSIEFNSFRKKYNL